MDDERKSLLLDSSTKFAQNGNKTIFQSESSTSSTISLSESSVRIPIYGTNSHPPAKLIPIEERVTYTWNDINVFANISTSPRSKFWNCFNKSSNRVIRKHILKNACGVAHPGELLAILGSSGAGKTTLLNALTFHSPASVVVSGTRCINGVAVNSKSLTSRSAYVQQDDLFMGNLTVEEHLIFQARVRMDHDLSHCQRMKRVEEVLSELALTKCRNTQIGIVGRTKGISGGEKKRLSFAAEVLTNPRLMFCDEPTSGLDSHMAYSVVQVLKSMAQTGKTIICTIHQPSSQLYAMFDKLLLMSEGRAAFLGSPEEADAFFKSLEAPCPKNYNPADYFVQLLAIIPEREESSRQAVNLICDKFERSPLGVKIALDAASTVSDYNQEIWFNGGNQASPYKASWCAQFSAVLWRSSLNVIKEPLLIKVRLLQTIVIALIIGIIYFHQELNEAGVMNINGVLFIFLTNMTFQNVFAVLNVFSVELQVFLREHRNGMYRTDVYFLCKTLTDLPVFVVIPTVFTTICYFMVGLNTEGYRFFIAVGVVVLVANVATSFGYFLSCASTSLSMALSLGPPLIIPFFLFGGFFLNISSIPLYFKWLEYLSWFRYGNEALLINQWRNVTEIACTDSLKLCPKDGDVVLATFNFRTANFLLDVVCLCVLIVGFRLLAYLALLLKTYQRK